MTVSTTDEEEAIRSKLADFARIRSELESLGATIPGQDNTDLIAAPTMPEAAATAGTQVETGTTPDTAIPIDTDAIATSTTQEQVNGRFTDLEAVFNRGGKLKYTTQLFVELPKEYHKDLHNLILHVVEMQ